MTKPEPQHESSTAAQERRFDRLCDDFEAQWQSGGRPKLEDFLGATSATDRSVLFGELLALELSYRADRGERPAADEYRARFAEHPETISPLFEVSNRLQRRIAAPLTQRDTRASRVWR